MEKKKITLMLVLVTQSFDHLTQLPSSYCDPITCNLSSHGKLSPGEQVFQSMSRLGSHPMLSNNLRPNYLTIIPILYPRYRPQTIRNILNKAKEEECFYSRDYTRNHTGNEDENEQITQIQHKQIQVKTWTQMQLI